MNSFSEKLPTSVSAYGLLNKGSIFSSHVRDLKKQLKHITFPLHFNKKKNSFRRKKTNPPHPNSPNIHSSVPKLHI